MGLKENSIKHFGKQAEAYSKGFIFQDSAHLSEIVRRSGVKKTHHVLDIATGSGFLALEYAKTGANVIGSDITRNLLVYALERQKNLGISNTGFLLSDVESLPFPERTFDIVSCRFAFHHFPDPRKALAEMKRAGTDANKTSNIKHLMTSSAADNGTGLRVKIEDSRLRFTYDTVILIGDCLD